MITDRDLQQIGKMNISEDMVHRQMEIFRSGIEYLKIDSAASITRGITAFSKDDIDVYINLWNEYLKKKGNRIIKFVPASGAASRMFKDLFAFVDSQERTHFVGRFFNEIEKFAFYEELDEACKKSKNKGLEELLIEGDFVRVLKIFLTEEGLNYGNLPKGLLLFHRNYNQKRTPFLEHLVEGFQYAKNSDNTVYVHFTVSPEHRKLFENHLKENIEVYSDDYGVKFNVTFSEQKKSTDTIAVNMDNTPFREDDGSILFRPAGHGALIENLNDLDADIVFIKNIDNVVPDGLKDTTSYYKKLLGGLLVAEQKQTFAFLRELDNTNISDAKLQVIAKYCDTRLGNKNSNISRLARTELIDYLKSKLNRPIRVCGMVKNEGEPGGGPYLVYNNDGTISPQILESSQIDTQKESQKAIMQGATHFNPVDLVCGLKDYNGDKFDLRKYVDENTYFVSEKSKNGKPLKALEMPGLWNGAMSDWNTIFVEVPIQTFNPVKNINDLLRTQHQ